MFWVAVIETADQPFRLWFVAQSRRVGVCLIHKFTTPHDSDLSKGQPVIGVGTELFGYKGFFSCVKTAGIHDLLRRHGSGEDDVRDGTLFLRQESQRFGKWVSVPGDNPSTGESCIILILPVPTKAGMTS